MAQRLQPCDFDHPNSVIPTGADHRKAMICGVEGPCVYSHNHQTRMSHRTAHFQFKIITQPGLASRTADPSGDSMAQNHYSTKRNRRPKNKNRKDYTQATMAAMRQHAENDPASNKNAKKAAS